MRADKLIFIYKQSCDKLVVKFLEDYFDAEYFDYTWVNYYGGIFEFADYYIDMNSVLECYKYNVSKDQFFLWYDEVLSQQSNLSLYDFISSPAKRAEAIIKHLEEIRERINATKKELKQALEDYATGN